MQAQTAEAEEATGRRAARGETGPSSLLSTFDMPEGPAHALGRVPLLLLPTMAVVVAAAAAALPQAGQQRCHASSPQVPTLAGLRRSASRCGREASAVCGQSTTSANDESWCTIPSSLASILAIRTARQRPTGRRRPRVEFNGDKDREVTSCRPAPTARVWTPTTPPLSAEAQPPPQAAPRIPCNRESIYEGTDAEVQPLCGTDLQH